MISCDCQIGVCDSDCHNFHMGGSIARSCALDHHSSSRGHASFLAQPQRPRHAVSLSHTMHVGLASSPTQGRCETGPCRSHRQQGCGCHPQRLHTHCPVCRYHRWKTKLSHSDVGVGHGLCAQTFGLGTHTSPSHPLETRTTGFYPCQ